MTSRPYTPFKLLSFFLFTFAVSNSFITLSQGVTEIGLLRYIAFENGSRLPSSFFENCYFGHVTVISM